MVNVLERLVHQLATQPKPGETWEATHHGQRVTLTLKRPDAALLVHGRWPMVSATGSLYGWLDPGFVVGFSPRTITWIRRVT